MFLCLYVILDLYSRYVVGWMVSCKEIAGLAKHLFSRVLTRHSIAPEQLIVRSAQPSGRGAQLQPPTREQR